jgi:DNA polymerase III epsilon subunit family exonuclease
MAGCVMPGLSDSQRGIVEYERLDRHMLVIAPPGSGKTHTIAQRIAWLLNTGRAEPDQVLALTYTNKAGRELKDRIAKQASPHVQASTLHSWSYDFLRSHGPEIGLSDRFQVCDDYRKEDLLRIAAVTAGIPMLAPEQLRSTSFWLSERKRNPSVEPNQRPPFNIEIMAAIEDSFRRQMKEHDLLDFDDLILLTGELLWQNAEVREPLHERLRFIFVDEYHDLSFEQFRLLTALAPGNRPGRQVMAVADPNQAIFGFRGGDAEEMLRRFQSDYRPERFELRENFRSIGRLVQSSNHLMRAGDGTVDSLPVREGSTAPHVHRLVTDIEEATWIAGVIEAGARKGKDYRDFAIVYRTHNRANVVEEILLGNDIPVARIQQNRFFDDRMVIEGFRYLQLVAALDDRTFEPAVNWPRVLVDELTMMQLRTAARDRGLRLTELASRPELLRSTVTPLGAVGIERFIQGLAREVGTVENARTGVERVLPLVRRRRDPIPNVERGNFLSTLHELAKAVDAVADTVFDAIGEGLPIRLRFDEGNADHVLAASILKRTIELGFATDVLLGDAGGRRCFDFSLTELDRHAGEFTCAALIYRLCQRLDERFDRSRRQRFVVFDLETTGTHISTAELLQIGAVVVENGRITNETFSTFVQPSGPDAIPRKVQEITGITWKEVADAPEPKAALRAFLNFVGTAPLAGHNIDAFDLELIRRLCAELGLEPPARSTIDTMKVWKRIHPDKQWSLEAALTREEIKQRRLHRADLDARLTARVFIDLMKEIGRERRATLLSDELPLVAASVALTGKRDLDSELLKVVGRRALALGQGMIPDRAADALMLPGRLDRATEALEAIELHSDGEDAHWERIERQWLESVGVYERTHADQTLQSFVRWFQLAVSTDIEHANGNRVAMMTIHAAKGREWPVVIMLGAEDDQYVFPADPNVAEGRRLFYVGMTRAQDLLIVTHARDVNGQERRPSRFLSDLDLAD